MIQFKPFKGIRPVKGKAANVTTKSVEYCNDAEIDDALKNNPESFFNIINPNLKNFSVTDSKKVREQLSDFINQKILVKDVSSYYIYEQQTPEGKKILGIVGLVSLDDYNNGLIRKHEETLKEKEDLFTEYLKTFNLQPDPVLLTFQSEHSIEVLVSMITIRTPTLEFKGVDQRTHKLWQVKDRLLMLQLKNFIEKLPTLYIADGHHRMESAAKYTEFRREKEPDYFGGEMFNYTPAIIIPGNCLQIYDHNRLIRNLNGLNKEEFLEKLKTVFSVIEKKSPYYPSSKYHISMYLDGKFYALYVNHNYRGIPKGLGHLDTYLWEKHIVKSILNLNITQQNTMIDYIKGTGDINGILKIKNKVDTNQYIAGFGFYPASINDLTAVVNEGKLMPPKSTYIYPKFLSALITLDLED